MKQKKGKKGTINRKIVLGTMIVVCVFLSISLAWYYYNTRRLGNSEEREVMVPYYLYLLDENQADYFQLQVLNMHPDEKKQVIVCVSNEDKDGSQLNYSVSRNSLFNYELEMAYTQNIPLNYEIYELEKLDDSMAAEEGVFKTEYEYTEIVEDGFGGQTQETRTGINYWRKKKSQAGAGDAAVPLQPKEPASQEETIANNKEMYGTTYEDEVVNVAKYDIYQTDADGNQFQLTTSFNGALTQYEHHYYMIEIQWDDNVRDFSKYLKEVDLVYVMVKAMQPEPKEKEGTLTNVNEQSLDVVTQEVPEEVVTP